jgi:hypothetical protein
VVWICAAVKIGLMAGSTYRGSSFETTRMAFQTFQSPVRSGQGKLGVVVIKSLVGIAIGMTGQAGIVLINVGSDLVVILVRFGFQVTVGTPEFCVVG